MKSARLLLAGFSLLTLCVALSWLGAPGRGISRDAFPQTVQRTGEQSPVLRLGLIPERNIFEQRRAYHLLADYLQTHIREPRGQSTLSAAAPLHVDLVTSSSYAGILRDFESRQVDAAFLGSLTAVLAVERYGAQVLLKSQTAEGAGTYAGVIFVRADSPIHALTDLKGKRMGGVATTTAGALYPVYAFMQAGISAENAPPLIFSGTHDDVIDEVLAGNLDAGAVKDLRLLAYERAHPAAAIRVISTGERVPENSLVCRGDLNAEIKAALAHTLITMAQDPAAAPVLQALGLLQFEPCEMREFKAVYAMADAIGPRWDQTGVAGPAPRFSTTTRPGGGK